MKKDIQICELDESSGIARLLLKEYGSRVLIGDVAPDLTADRGVRWSMQLHSGKGSHRVRL